MNANSWCKNKNCTKGINGERSFYYSCKFCAKTENWRSVACCQECYIEYIAQIHEARSKNVLISKDDLLPDRTDMTKAEIKELLNKPLEEVIQETKEELEDYHEDLETIGFTGVVDKINKELAIEENIVNLPTKGRKKRKLF